MHMQKRKDVRFSIPGTTLRIQSKRLIFFLKAFGKELFPLYELSRGGIRFKSNRRLKVDHPLLIKLSLPHDLSVIRLFGKIKWIGSSPDHNFSYQIGVQLAPFGRQKGQNTPEDQRRLAWAESRFIGIGRDNRVTVATGTVFKLNEKHIP